MNFSFSPRGKRQPIEARYAFVKASLPDTQRDLCTALLSGSLASASAGKPMLTAIRNEIRFGDPGFIERLATYFGEHGHPVFRELSFLLTAELAAQKGRDVKTALLVGRIVSYPTDVPKWLAYFAAATKDRQRPGRAIREQLTMRLNLLDEYQYSRCDAATRLGLRKALRMLKPGTHDPDKKILFSRICRDLIPIRTTWTQEWQALSQQHFDSSQLKQMMLREKWKEGISTFRIGYPVLLENVRPMLSSGISGRVLQLAAEYLGSAAAVRNSRTPPIRLLAAYRSLRQMTHYAVSRLSEALEKAALHSTWSSAEFGANGISVIAMDVSNSMRTPLDRATEVERFDIAPLLAMSWKSRGKTIITGVLGNTWRTLDLLDRPVLMTVDAFRRHEAEAGYGINAWLVIRDLYRKKLVVDRVMIFTDCRLWDNRSFDEPAGPDFTHWWRQYRSQLAPQAQLYLFDLAGYGYKSLECPDEGVFLIAGWKENIFEALHALETGYRTAE